MSRSPMPGASAFPSAEQRVVEVQGREGMFLLGRTEVRSPQRSQSGTYDPLLFRKSWESLRKEVGSDLRVPPAEA